MTRWTRACAQGDLEFVRAHVQSCMHKSIRRGWRAAIEGDHVDVAHLLAQHVGWDECLASLDTAVPREQVRMLREVLLPHFDQNLGHKSSAWIAQKVEWMVRFALQLCRIDMLGVVLDSRLNTLSSTSMACWAAYDGQLDALACIASHRMCIATPIGWDHVLIKWTRHVDTALWIEARALAEGKPLPTSIWMCAIYDMAMYRSEIAELRPLLRLCAQRFQAADPSDDMPPARIDLCIQRVIFELLDLSTQECDGDKYLDWIGAACDICRAFDTQKCWTLHAVCEIVKQPNSTVSLEFAFHIGWFTRADLIHANTHPTQCTHALAILDAFQAKQHARRLELDRATDLPRVLGDLVMGY
jgi:hypothetical protein